MMTLYRIGLAASIFCLFALVIAGISDATHGLAKQAAFDFLLAIINGASIDWIDTMMHPAAAEASESA